MTILAKRQLSIAGVLEEISRAIAFVTEAAEAAGLDERAVYQCQLAVDETCTNVIEHGYGENGRDHVIDLTCQMSADRFIITITDDSPPFDPLSIPEPDKHAAIDERSAGGWGVHFVRKMMDEVRYSHESGRNQLTLTKMRSAASTPAVKAQPQVTVDARDLTPRVSLVTVKGRLDTDSISMLEQAIEALMADSRKNFVLELANVSFLSSGALKRIVRQWQRVRDKKGDLVLAAPSVHVSEVLHLTGLELVFTVEPAVENVLKHFDRKPTKS